MGPARADLKYEIIRRRRRQIGLVTVGAKAGERAASDGVVSAPVVAIELGLDERAFARGGHDLQNVGFDGEPGWRGNFYFATRGLRARDEGPEIEARIAAALSRRKAEIGEVFGACRQILHGFPCVRLQVVAV